MNIRIINFFFGLGAFISAISILLGIVWVLGKLSLIQNENMGSLQILFSVLLIALVFTSIGFWGLSLGKLHYLGQRKQISTKQIISLLLASLFLIFFNGFLFNFLGLEVRQFENFNKALLLEEWYFFLPAICLIAPIWEEFFFRGILLGTWLKNNRTKLSCLSFSLLSSILFVLIHFEKSFTLGTWISLLSLALYLSWISIYYGVWQAIIVHVFNNFLSFSMMLLKN